MIDTAYVTLMSDIRAVFCEYFGEKNWLRRNSMALYFEPISYVIHHMVAR